MPTTPLPVIRRESLHPEILPRLINKSPPTPIEMPDHQQLQAIPVARITKIQYPLLVITQRNHPILPPIRPHTNLRMQQNPVRTLQQNTPEINIVRLPHPLRTLLRRILHTLHTPIRPPTQRTIHLLQIAHLPIPLARYTINPTTPRSPHCKNSPNQFSILPMDFSMNQNIA
jgi:hypothetical protein